MKILPFFIIAEQSSGVITLLHFVTYLFICLLFWKASCCCTIQHMNINNSLQSLSCPYFLKRFKTAWSPRFLEMWNIIIRMPTKHSFFLTAWKARGEALHESRKKNVISYIMFRIKTHHHLSWSSLSLLTLSSSLNITTNVTPGLFSATLRELDTDALRRLDFFSPEFQSISNKGAAKLPVMCAALTLWSIIPSALIWLITLQD